jgi:hypothetical protein
MAALSNLTLAQSKQKELSLVWRQSGNEFGNVSHNFFSAPGQTDSSV